MPSVAEQIGMSDGEAARVIGAHLNLHLTVILTYGLYTTIFVSALQHIVSRREWPPQRVALAVVLCVIWALATVYFGMMWNALVSVYVVHGQSRESILGYILTYGPGDWSKRELVLGFVAATSIALNAMIVELTNIWRCWVLYNRKWLVVALPLLGVIGGLISHIFRMATTYSSDPLITASMSQVNWTIVYYAVTTSANILTTVLIIVRILSVGGLKSARTYRGILEILIESSFLYSATYLVFLGLYARDTALPYWSVSNWYAVGLLNAVTAAVPTLIIERVFSGGTHPNDLRTRYSRSHMHHVNNIPCATIHPAHRLDTITTLDLVHHDTRQIENITLHLSGQRDSSPGSKRSASLLVDAECCHVE